MITKVTGCKDCPLYEGTDSEYGVYCHHPISPIHITKYSGTPGHFLEIELSEDIIEKMRIDYRNGGVDFPIGDDLLRIEECEILSDDNYDPITPDWCPLNKESITIQKTNE